MSSFAANQGPLSTANAKKLTEAAEVCEDGGFNDKAAWLRSWARNTNWQCPPGVRPPPP